MAKKTINGENEAIALGAMRAGSQCCNRLPRYASTEVLETVAKHNDGKCLCGMVGQ